MMLERQTIGWINREKPDLLFTETDAEAIQDHVGGAANRFDSFFVQTEDGEYSEIWGMYGVVPRNIKSVYRIR